MNNTIASFILGTFTITTGLLMIGSPSSNAQEEVLPTAQQYLMNLSMSQQDAYVLIEECRKTDQPNKCVKFAGAIRAQEGGYQTRHPFGMLRQPSRYKGVKEKTTGQYAELRVGSFERYWIRNNTPQDYLSRSKYCTSGCSHRVGNVNRFIAGYDSGVIPQEGKQPVGTSELINTYEIARQATIKRQNTEKQLSELNIKLGKEIVEEHKTRRDCKTSKQCIDN